MNNLNLLRLASRYQMLAVVIGGLLFLWLLKPYYLSFIVGGAFAWVNFWIWRFLLQKTLTTIGKRKIIYTFLLAFKMVLALGIITVLWFVFKLHPLGFAIGLTTFIIGVFTALFHASLFYKNPTVGN
ncbi:MAG: ATP synthase subunit I [Deltaproteobacteria bacterium]|nr:ATP synthase subunit I [Deltaproteobacteria bacterium]